MQVSESTDPTIAMAPVPGPPAAAGLPAAAEQTHARCDECGAAVADDQRYCVVCGAHRKHVNDPAAQYLSQATARSRGSRTGAPARSQARPAGRARGLGTALVLALIPVAAAGGVLAGRSSSNDDAALIQALAKHQTAATTTTAAASSANTAASTQGASKSTSTAKHKSSHHAARQSSAATSTPSTKNAGKVISTTQYGSAQQITGFKATKSEEQQGAADTQQVQKSTGKNYVNAQSNLPSQVVVP